MKRYLIFGFLSLCLALTGLLNAAERRGDGRDSRDRERSGSDWRDMNEPGKQWQLLGKHEVDYRGDRDRINVGDAGRHDGRFRELQIRVDGAPVEIRKMVVNFDNGQTFDAITQRHRFDENNRTLRIDLPGDRRRDIKSIDLNYFSVTQREGKGTLLVYAR